MVELGTIIAKKAMHELQAPVYFCVIRENLMEDSLKSFHFDALEILSESVSCFCLDD